MGIFEAYGRDGTVWCGIFKGHTVPPIPIIGHTPYGRVRSGKHHCSPPRAELDRSEELVQGDGLEQGLVVGLVDDRGYDIIQQQKPELITP